MHWDLQVYVLEEGKMFIRYREISERDGKEILGEFPIAIDLYEFSDLMLDYYLDVLLVKRVIDKSAERKKHHCCCWKMPVAIMNDRGTEFNWVEKLGIIH